MLKDAPAAPEFLEHLKSAEVIVDQWQLEKLAMVTQKADLLYYVPGLTADFYPSLWGQAFNSVEDAFAALTEGLPAGARIAVIPEGPYVLAKISGSDSKISAT